jgi:hypothetical protein
MANTVVVDNLKQYYGKETITLLNGNYDIDNLEEWLIKISEKNALKDIKNYGKEHIELKLSDLMGVRKKMKIKTLHDMYISKDKNNLSFTRENAFKERHNLLQMNLRDNLYSITTVLKYNTKIVNNLSDKIKSIINIDNEYNGPNTEVPTFDSIDKIKNIDDQELNIKAQDEIENLVENVELQIALNKLKYVYVNMLSNYNFIHKTRSIIDYLKIYRNKSLGIVIKPKTFNTAQFVKENVDEILKNIQEEKKI